MNKLRKIFLRGAALFCVLAPLFLVGCNAGQVDNNELTEEQRNNLIERVTLYWQALSMQDYDAAYEYTTPNYRDVFSKDMFLNNFGYSVEWELTAVEVTNYDAPAAVASVSVRVMSTPIKPTSEASRLIGAIPANLNEKWLLREGEWWKSAKIE